MGRFRTFTNVRFGSFPDIRERLLSPGFLETILLHDPFRRAVPCQGVRIIGTVGIRFPTGTPFCCALNAS